MEGLCVCLEFKGNKINFIHEIPSTIRHWVIFWAQKPHQHDFHRQPSSWISFKIHERQKILHRFPKKENRFCYFHAKDMRKVFPPLLKRWDEMDEWVNGRWRRFKLHIQSYCCVCLELQMFINSSTMPQYHHGKDIFYSYALQKKRNNDEGGKNLFFITMSFCGTACGWDGMIIMAE